MHHNSGVVLLTHGVMELSEERARQGPGVSASVADDSFCRSLYTRVERAAGGTGKTFKWVCSLCSTEVSASSVTRLWEHFVGKPGKKGSDVARCAKLSLVANAEVQKQLREASSRRSNAAATTQANAAGAKVLLQQTMDAGSKLSAVEAAHRSIARFFYENAVAFNKARSRSFRAMISACIRAGLGFVPTEYNRLRTTELEKVRPGWTGGGCLLIIERR